MMVLSRPLRQAERNMLARITVGDSLARLAIVTVRQSCLEALSFVDEGCSWSESD